MRSNPITPPTRIVASTRAALTIWFGSGRAHPVPSAHDHFATANQPIAVPEAGQCRRDEIGLVGSKRCEVPDPGAADAEAEQDQWRDAA
jgi:hypothetical protein